MDVLEVLPNAVHCLDDLGEELRLVFLVNCAGFLDQDSALAVELLELLN